MVTVAGVSKRYGSVQALDQVSAEFHPGEIHAVLGENGAGKSTLMGVLSGFVSPDDGSVSIEGEPVPLGDPYRTRRAGVSMVHQHFTLVPAFTVAENLALASVGSLAAVHPERLASPALKQAAALGWTLNADSRVRDLPVGVRQRIEILKALTDEARVLIFDEPTAVLSADEVDDLFRVLRALRDQGKTVLLIAHKLAEVMAIADRVTVLRRGKFVATATTDSVDAPMLAHWMVGSTENPSPQGSTVVNGVRGPTLEVREVFVVGDRGEMAVRGVSLSVEPGEILGIGGVDGNGQVELAEAVAGVRPVRSGTVVGSSGCVAYIPQDRQTDGLALSMSILDNLLIEGHRRPELRKGPLLLSGKIRRWAHELVDRFDIRIGKLGDPVSSLSGGNQQKVVVARCLDHTPQLLVAVNPTRGLDIQATRFVHDQIRGAAKQGAKVVLFSTDADELAELSHQQLTMASGVVRADDLASSLIGGSP